MNFYTVAANYPKRNSLLTYKSAEVFLPGAAVTIPLGRRETGGVIIEKMTTKPEYDESKIKEIVGINPDYFDLDENELKLFTWMSDYYHYSLGKLIFESVPKKLKRPRTITRESEDPPEPYQLADEQKEIIDKIKAFLDKGFSQHLVHGITGSGKSFIYLELMKEVLKSGKSVHFVLPEINLTPQFTHFFSNAFEVPVFVYHSNVTQSEKFSLWKHLKENDGPVLAIGVRSSLFLPFRNLGLIVVDEEHDSSFKQDSRCLYNARDSLQKKASDHQVPIVLGSATPSLETLYTFKEKNNYYFLNKRFGDAVLPKLEFIDAKFDGEFEELWPLSKQSVDALEEAIKNKEQALVFINKLGFASFIQCRSCGHRFHCLNCDSNLRVFKHKHMLSCGQCTYTEVIPKSCPECGNMKLLNKGFGTEKVQEVLKKRFPDLKIERFDREEITTMKKLEAKLDSFEKGEIDIFVGTQMLSKGHNFKRVNLVIVLGVDQQMNFSDFRAQERTFQLIKQVSGRAGRYSDKGKVLVQTMSPEQPLFKKIKDEKDLEIYAGELEYRRMSSTPPFSHMATFYLVSKFRDRVITEAENIANRLLKTIKDQGFDIEVLGPAPLAIEKRVNQFGWYISLKSSKRNELHQLINAFEQNFKMVSNLQIKIDVDPYNAM